MLRLNFSWIKNPLLSLTTRFTSLLVGVSLGCAQEKRIRDLRWLAANLLFTIEQDDWLVMVAGSGLRQGGREFFDALGCFDSYIYLWFNFFKIVGLYHYLYRLVDNMVLAQTLINNFLLSTGLNHALLLHHRLNFALGWVRPTNYMSQHLHLTTLNYLALIILCLWVQLYSLRGEKARLRHWLAFKFPVDYLRSLAHLIVMSFQSSIARQHLIVDIPYH
jgi:hypothetical protein